MARLILILASVIMLAGAAIGFKNRGEFIKVRNDKDQSNAQIQIALDETDDLVSEIKDTQSSIGDTENERDVARVGVEETGRKLNDVNTLITTREGEIKKRDNRIAEIQKALEPFRGVSLDNLKETVEQMKLEVETKQEESAQRQKEIEVARAAVARDRETIQGYVADQEKRSRLIALNSVEGTVVAVNQDYGFAVINVGGTRGVTGDTRLLVKRGSENVGELKPISIDRDVTVANIDQGSLASGARIMPGDRVVFETPTL